MADMNTLERLLREAAARQAEEQTGAPTAGQAGPAWTHTDTGAMGPTLAAATRYATPGQGFAPHGGIGFPPWGAGPAGNMMPPPGAVTRHHIPSYII